MRETGGSLNDNFRAETDAGRMFVRCHRVADMHFLARLEAEGDLILAAGELGIPVAPPLGEGPGRYLSIGGRFWSVYRWVEGSNLPRGETDASGAEALGHVHGRTHVALAAARPAFEHRHLAPRPAWHTASALALLAETAEAVEGADIAEERRAWLLERLRFQAALLNGGAGVAYEAFAHVRRHLIHGDFHDRNVLFDGALNATAVVDWELFQLTPRLFELLRCVTFAKLLDRALLGAYLRGYRQHVAFEKDEAESAVEMWWQSRLHDTWAMRQRFVLNDMRVDDFVEAPSPVEELSRGEYRRELVERLLG